MKILIAGSVQGDGSYEEEALCQLLKEELAKQGHATDLFFLPYGRNMLSLPEQLLAYQLLQINDCDMLITVGYPACTLKHPNKICYLFQTEPMLFEYWDSAYGVLANHQYSQIHYLARDAEQAALTGARGVFVNSNLLAEDLTQRYHLACTVLKYPPLLPEIGVAVDGDLPYLLCESSLLPWQRPELLLELCAGTGTCVKLFVPNAEAIYLETFQKQIFARTLESQITVTCQRASQADIQGAAAIFLPDYQIRRIPNIALCALRWQRPLLALGDCGALSELVLEENLLSVTSLTQKGNFSKWSARTEYYLPSDREFAKELLTL